MDYKSDLKIDKGNLDSEFERQPTLYMQYSEEVNKKQQELDDKKLANEVLEADLYFKASDQTWDKKPTVADLANWVKRNPERVKSIEEYNSLKHELNNLKSAVSSFEQKKDSLKGLKDLWNGGYWSEVGKSDSDNTRIRRKKTDE